MADRLDEFEYLWTDPAGDWVLIREEAIPDYFSIYNLGGHVLLLEHDDILRAAVCQRMMEAGCRILDDIPDVPLSSFDDAEAVDD